VDLVVVVVPTKFRVYRDLCSFDANAACPSWPVDDLPRTVREAVAEVSGAVGYLDLTRRLRAEAASGAVLYLPDDPHWTAEGHRVAARALAEYLDSRPAADGPVTAAR
jgi:hypothetical protein